MYYRDVVIPNAPNNQPFYLNIKVDEEKFKTFGGFLVGAMHDNVGLLDIKDHPLLHGYSSIRAPTSGKWVLLHPSVMISYSLIKKTSKIDKSV